MISSEHSIANLDTKFSIELDKVSNWLKVNKLSLNLAKTKAMMFHTPQRKVNKLKLIIDNHEIVEILFIN